ncbi:GNAT family N-acetyltransferase [Capillimicrobium parvum]|uniref:N-acetyltransferase domain-containing protein n=1 Tax=Capillimicrobium parvum TaxID=2884022 RepID=A0A9E7BWY7_9ACTN|nr:GNAT family N-acetyltransferase [Capillimicrobium parvum]UGS33976.1 hypothetical protein DSM104329_00343 [Capillimicrobium parvum]
MNTRPLTPQDRTELARFFAEIPEADRNFLKDDVQEPQVLERWLDDEIAVRLVAVDEEGGRIVAFAALWPGIGRSSHVADLRLIVAHDARRRGLGREMARLALAEGLRHGWRKFTVDVPATHQSTINMFSEIGFRPEALLVDHLQEPDGRMHDIVSMAHIADDAWAEMLTTGLADTAR